MVRLSRFVDKKVNEAFEEMGRKTNEALNNFKSAFSNSDYEIECLVAELELNIPQVGEGSLKVTIKKKDANQIASTQSKELLIEPKEIIES